MSTKLVQFSAHREDLLFAYGGEVMDGVQLRLRKDEEFSPQDGPVLTEAEGFDFRNELKPELRVSISDEAISEKLKELSAEDLDFHVTIEDVRLHERVPIVSIPISELVDQPRTITVDLSRFDEFYFSGGFELRCLIHRNNDVKPTSGPWSKSHVILHKSFLAKSSEEQALFDINWVEFDDPEERENVWYFVNWDSLEVSVHPGAELFRVSANLDLRPQFKRLENNSQFGHLSVRQMATEILHEIVFTTLKYSDLESEPASESLQEQIQLLLDERSIDFREMASAAQGGNDLELEQSRATIKRLCQRVFGVGKQLSDTKFGGFRGQ